MEIVVARVDGTEIGQSKLALRVILSPGDEGFKVLAPVDIGIAEEFQRRLAGRRRRR